MGVACALSQEFVHLRLSIKPVSRDQSARSFLLTESRCVVCVRRVWAGGKRGGCRPRRRTDLACVGRPLALFWTGVGNYLPTKRSKIELGRASAVSCLYISRLFDGGMGLSCGLLTPLLTPNLLDPAPDGGNRVL